MPRAPSETDIDLYYDPEYVGAAYAFDTTRKAQRIAESLLADPIEGVRHVGPVPVTIDDLLTVHDARYVRAVRDGVPRELAESQGFDWDEGLWRMVLATNGGGVAAALSALHRGVAGSLSSGLHHARRERGSGNCTFNGLVLAAHAALNAGAASVLILDLDAHCGGGTASLIADEPRIRQCDIAVSSFDAYHSTEQARLVVLQEASAYLPAIESMLATLDAARRSFDLCIYNAGVDPYEGCAVGGLSGITREMLARRERIVFDWCGARGIPVAFVIAGGYVGQRLDRATLVALHRQTIAAASTLY
jgi:acetoin utilization deacetylase AcuC-like enzyme